MDQKLGYRQITGAGYKHSSELWIFEFFRGQRIFQTDVLDPVQEPGNHRVIRKYKNLTLAAINPDDLIISKMFRGTDVDVQDSIAIIKAEKLNMPNLAERYRETAGYYHNPVDCKLKLGYLIAEMRRQGMDATSLKEMSDLWNP